MTDPDLEPAAERKGSALGADLIIPVFALAFTIYFLATTANLVWEARANGTVIGVALLALVAVQFVRVYLRRQAGGGTWGLGEIVERSAAQGQRLALLAIVIVFIAVIPWLGTTLGLFLVMLASMYVLGVRRPGTLVGVSLAVAAVVYLLFIAFLQSRLPAGPVERLLGPLFGA